MSNSEVHSHTDQREVRCYRYVHTLLKKICSVSKETVTNAQYTVVITDSAVAESQEYWVKIDKFHLFESYREILLDNNRWLNDNHMLCAQQRQFPQYTGLQPTSLQQVGPLKPLPPESQSLQILQKSNDHWIAVSTVGCAASTAEGIDIIVYDSKYFSLSTDTSWSTLTSQHLM